MVKAPAGGDVDQVSVTSNSLRDDSAGQGEGLSRTDEAAGNLNDTRENAGYVSIVDRMLGMSAKPSQKYDAAEQDKDPKEMSENGKRDQKEEKKNDVCIIVESARNQTEAEEVEVELSPQQVVDKPPHINFIIISISFCLMLMLMLVGYQL